MSEQVECDNCGVQVRLRRDGTYGRHGWTRDKVYSVCENSGERYRRHVAEFRVIIRDGMGIGTMWLAECRCGESWTGADYDEAFRPWQAHIRAVRAVAS